MVMLPPVAATAALQIRAQSPSNRRWPQTAAVGHSNEQPLPSPHPARQSRCKTRHRRSPRPPVPGAINRCRQSRCNQPLPCEENTACRTRACRNCRRCLPPVRRGTGSLALCQRGEARVATSCASELPLTAVLVCASAVAAIVPRDAHDRVKRVDRNEGATVSL